MIVFTVNLGAIAPHIHEQLPQLPTDSAEKFELFRVAINRLRINGLMSSAESLRSERRLVKMIAKAMP